MTDYVANVSESVTFSEATAKLATRRGTSSAAFSDAYVGSSAVATSAELAEFSDVAGWAGQYVRAVVEAVVASDLLLPLSVIAKRFERIRVLDLVLGAADAVLNYLTVLQRGSREDDMLKLFEHGPVGFSRFKRFYPGTFRFQNMLVKTVLLTRDKNTRPRIAQLKTTIDVADKRLQGSATVTLLESQGAGHAVVFSAQFFQPPEVIVMWKGGAAQGRAEVVPGSVTAVGFSVRVFDVTTNAPIAGEITFAVLGY